MLEPKEPNKPNNTKLPLTTAYACLTGYFVWEPTVTPHQQTLAELMVITPNKGSIADLSPSGWHYGEPLENLQGAMHKMLFEERIARAGDVVDAAKIKFFSDAPERDHDVIDTMILFGDPALKLRYPTGDLSSSTLKVSDAKAPIGATLSYTLTVRNSSIFTTRQPKVEVTYPQTQATLVYAGGADVLGNTLTWNLPDLPAGGQQVLTYKLRERASGRTPESYDLIVPATVSSQMAPSVSLEARTTIGDPLSVTLGYFSGSAYYPNYILLEWQSVSELNNTGFNLYRTGSAVDPPNPADMLAFVPSQAPGSTAGADYSYQDSSVVAGQTYWYWLADVDLSGVTTLHGPISVSYEAPTALTLGEMRAASAGVLSSSVLLLLALTAALAIGGVFAARRMSAKA